MSQGQAREAASDPNVQPAESLHGAGYMAVYLTSEKGRRPEGILRNQFVEGDMPFCGLDDLLLKVQAIGGALPFPEGLFDRRFLNAHAQSAEAAYRHMHRDKRPARCRTLEEVLDPPPRTRALVIELRYRQGGDMQGILRCAEAGGRPLAFRNGMELLGLLAAQNGSMAEQEIRGRIRFA